MALGQSCDLMSEQGVSSTLNKATLNSQRIHFHFGHKFNNLVRGTIHVELTSLQVIPLMACNSCHWPVGETAARVVPGISPFRCGVMRHWDTKR